MSTGKRLLVIAATRRGALLAERLAAALPEVEAHVADRWHGLSPSAHRLEAPLAEALPRLFREPTVGGLVVVLAVGATVRLLAPWLQDKERDPAVVCVDDGGQFAIALLSGHLGGANALAGRVADALGARPVITTASEADGLLAVDLLGTAAGWQIEATPAALRSAAAAVVNGDPVAVFQDAGDTAWQRASDVPPNVQVVACLRQAADAAALLVISDRTLDLSGAPVATVVYRPPTLVAGLGCSLGASREDIASAVDRALVQGGLARGSLARLATLDRRRDEPGVVAYARQAGLPLETFAAQALASVTSVPNPSTIVRAAVGTPGVCEPAALLASGAASLLVPKVKTPRATAAIARIARGTGTG